MLKRFPACRALPLRQLAEFSQRPLDRPNLARSREKVLHGVVDFRHAWVITPAIEKARESKQRDGGGEFRLLAAEISGCSDQRRWVCALRGGTFDSDVEKPEFFAAANHLPLSPRVSIRSRSIRRWSRSGYVRTRER